MEDNTRKITALLHEVKENQPAADELIRLVYDELRRIAEACLRRERPGHTLQATALINEAWLRLAEQQRVDWRDRSHFFGVAAQMMRRILVDYARARLAGKRGGGTPAMNLDWLEIDSGPPKMEEILAVDQALSALRQFDPRQAQIVEMRYFAGLTVEETAVATGIAPRTVDREWSMASAWLRRELAGRRVP